MLMMTKTQKICARDANIACITTTNFLSQLPEGLGGGLRGLFGPKKESNDNIGQGIYQGRMILKHLGCDLGIMMNN